MNKSRKYYAASLPDESFLLKELAGTEENAVRAFEIIHNHYRKLIERTLNTFPPNDEEETKDTVQLIFTKLWENRKQAPGIRLFQGYLVRMAKNTMIDQFRKQQTRRTHELNQHTWISAGASPESLLIVKEYYAIIAGVSKGLPARRRKIFQMTFLYHRTPDEIARQLGISRDAVKKQLYAAHNAIKEKFKQLNQSG